jgi:hypothetical protein
MCCGQRRTELRNSQTQRTPPSAAPNGAAYSRVQAVRTQTPVPPPAAPTPPVNTRNRRLPPQAWTATSTQYSSMSVRYLENSPIRVRGSVSGTLYAFSGSQAVQQVDARDASSLLSTRFFRRA